MGDELLVTTVPSEALALGGLLELDIQKGAIKERRIRELYSREEWYRLTRNKAELYRRHPGAYYQIAIRPGAVWKPPHEPLGELRYGGASERRAHALAMKASLDRYLNERLGRLCGMMRTGWWILGDVRVRVDRLRGVPERMPKT